MDYKTKNFRLKISIGVHSKNTRWGVGVVVPVCRVCPVCRGGGVQAVESVESVHPLQ